MDVGKKLIFEVHFIFVFEVQNVLMRDGIGGRNILLQIFKEITDLTVKDLSKGGQFAYFNIHTIGL